jgi:phosphoribosylanthranilate isomerase
MSRNGRGAIRAGPPRGAPVSGWIKICGMTSAAGVSAAVEAGADAIGFVFAPSARRVNTERANALVHGMRKRILCVAVMLHPTREQVDEIVREFRPDLLQADAEDYAGLHLPQRLARLPVLRANNTEHAEYPPRILFEGASSGSGKTADWQQAALLARRTRLVLAGGLTVDNVAEAIRTVRPYGVDTSSGVELRPGEKSPELIRQFVQAARAAFSENPP